MRLRKGTHEAGQKRKEGTEPVARGSVSVQRERDVREGAKLRVYFPSLLSVDAVVGGLSRGWLAGRSLCSIDGGVVLSVWRTNPRGATCLLRPSSFVLALDDEEGEGSRWSSYGLCMYAHERESLRSPFLVWPLAWLVSRVGWARDAPGPSLRRVTSSHCSSAHPFCVDQVAFDWPHFILMPPDPTRLWQGGK